MQAGCSRLPPAVSDATNAGKTSILQRVCETTDSPEIYRVQAVNGKEIREQIRLDPTSETSWLFTNHAGYVFHDSRGFESGNTNEMELVEAFVCDRSQRRELQERLHAIWVGHRSFPQDLSSHECPKYEAFKRNVRMDLEDEPAGRLDDIERRTQDECRERFKTRFWEPLGASRTFVRLEGMNKPDRRCDELVRTTMDALNPDAVALMLVAVQKGNLELSVRRAVGR
ncbi:hypothetical protein B0H11DRAFT_1932101 [Mycena galericulata]|nr:hypothetical protein B0H11DRAFT_1932101 [Mycena galericulata]